MDRFLIMSKQFKQEFLDFINGGFFKPLNDYELDYLAKEFSMRLGTNFNKIRVDIHNGCFQYLTFLLKKEYENAENPFCSEEDFSCFTIASYDLFKNKELQNELLAFLETGEVGDLIRAEAVKR